MTDIERLRELKLFLEAACQMIPFDDKKRQLFISPHQAWEPKAYGSNEYVRYASPGEDYPYLYMSVRNVPANAPAPNIGTSPANWKRVI